MSIYDYRDTPAYVDLDAPISYCDNQYINSWWTEDHDKMILSQIELAQWNWPWDISNVIVSDTPQITIENWRDTDPLCKQYAWYNILMYYSVAKAKKLGYLKRIRKENAVKASTKCLPMWKAGAKSARTFRMISMGSSLRSIPTSSSRNWERRQKARAGRLPISFWRKKRKPVCWRWKSM